jgi:phosphatidylglycerophosphate synthase
MSENMPKAAADKHHGAENDEPTDPDANWRYPALAKPDSDGAYCYVVQRRLSCHITRYSVRLGITANQATLIDLLLALATTACICAQWFGTSVLLLQLFGLWSCVDGETARLTRASSTLGDFYDTMVDRTAEFLVVGSIFLVVPEYDPSAPWGVLFVAYMGAVFLITASSEKYRSAYRENYPKKREEPLFCWICAGSDTRFLYLSVGLLGLALFQSAQWMLVVVWILTVTLFLNFLFRMFKVYQLAHR